MNKGNIFLAFLFVAFISATTYAAAISNSAVNSSAKISSHSLAKEMSGACDKYASLSIVLDSVVAIDSYRSRAYFGYVNSSNDVIYICQDTVGSEAYTYNVLHGALSIDSALFYLQYFYPGEHHVLYGNEFPNYCGKKMSATFASNSEIAWTLGYSTIKVDRNGEVVNLPVELTSFSAHLQGANAQLKWSTATETNNAGFQIERNIEGSNAWVKVVFVHGAGTSFAPNSYSYEDKNLGVGTYLYRLKQIDNCGTETIYHTDELQKIIVENSITVPLLGNYPNPFNPSTTIAFTTPTDGQATLKVYNVIGQLVATLFDGPVKAQQNNTVMFHASKYSSGIYFSILESGNQRLVKKMTLMK